MTTNPAPPHRPLQILVVGDEGLRREVEAALAGARPGRAFLRLAVEAEDAERQLRQRSADLIVCELGASAGELRRFAATVRALSAEAALVGVQSIRGETATPSDVLVEAVRSKLDDILERPLSSESLREVLTLLEVRAEQTSAQTGSVIAFHSTKGGVGKSTLSINTAVGLALRHPDQVLLIDCSLQLGVCASALDLVPRNSIATAARERDRLDARMLRELSELHESTGLRLLSAPTDAIDASDVDDQAIAQLIALARRTFRFVIVDTLPIVDAVMLVVFDLADRIYLVNQGTVPDVIGAARLREMLDQIEIPADRTRVVLNRTMPPFPGQLVRAEVGRRIGRDVDFEVPYDKHVLTALNLGEPRIVAAGRRGWGAVLSEIVDDADAIGREASTGAAGELAEREAVPATRASVEVASPDAGGVPDRRSGLGRRLWAFASGAKS
jgi:pilus assembly protein CpaE